MQLSFILRITLSHPKPYDIWEGKQYPEDNEKHLFVFCSIFPFEYSPISQIRECNVCLISSPSH